MERQIWWRTGFWTYEIWGKSYSTHLLVKWPSEPQSLLLSGDNSTNLMGFTELNEIKHILAQCLQSNKLLRNTSCFYWEPAGGGGGEGRQHTILLSWILLVLKTIFYKMMIVHNNSGFWWIYLAKWRVGIY